jgi:hypothetical protein
VKHNYRITVEWEVAVSSDDAENLSDEMVCKRCNIREATVHAWQFADALGIDPTGIHIKRTR